MYRRLLVLAAAAALVMSFAGCTNKKVQNPIANVGTKQPDKVLFDRAMDAMKHNKFDVARMTLQTLINTYPDSEFIARAKLSIGDSWYAEGGTAAMQQAEAEYKDFETFFPNMPEAAEAQFKVAKIHYDQMEKPDRDFTHAKRAEEEYRNMIMQYPDSALVPQAKERLREVQEVLAEREYRIGRFYYLRESWAAAIARLKSLTDTYPLYSGADDALFMLGDSYERQITFIRANSKIPEPLKGKLIKDFEDNATQAYSRIVSRYPVGDRAGDAKGRLEALKRPVPAATPEAIAQNKKEIESRSKLGMWSRTMLTMHKRPDIAETARVGEPTLVDPRQTSAPEISKHTMEVITGKPADNHQVSVERVGTGQPDANQPVPRSDNQVDPNAPAQQVNPDAPAQQEDGIQSLAPTTGSGQPASQPPATQTPASQNPAAGAPAGQASPMTPAAQPPAAPSQPASTMQEATAAQPAQNQPAQNQATEPGGATPAAPSQVNDVNTGNDQASSASSSKQTDDKDMSSSKKKKKKGLSKLNPF